jgi:hypothetical protein
MLAQPEELDVAEAHTLTGRNDDGTAHPSTEHQGSRADRQETIRIRGRGGPRE